MAGAAKTQNIGLSFGTGHYIGQKKNQYISAKPVIQISNIDVILFKVRKWNSSLYSIGPYWLVAYHKRDHIRNNIAQ